MNKDMFCNNIQHIEEFEAPLDILEQLGTGRSEMKPSELAFLCGLIQKYRPRKLLEVGIAAGGTSVVICNCIEKLRLDTELFFVDLSESYYREPTKSSGYLLDELHMGGTRLLGRSVAGRLQEIGDGIDFVVLDTMHTMPGENLDFLACLPYLNEGAIVVLHDTALHFRADHKSSYATNVLLHTVTANKFLNNQEAYPNIAAFQVTADTYRYIADVFLGLMIPWHYMPNKELLLEYEAKLCEHYPEECVRIYHQAKVQMGEILERPLIPLAELRCVERLWNAKDILIYGTGKNGIWTLDYLRALNVPVRGFVVSDGRKKEDYVKEFPVYNLSEIPYEKEGTLIVKSAGAAAVESILKSSEWSWLPLSFK